MAKDQDYLAESVGAAVRARRKAKSMTQEDLAATIEVSVITLSNIERGENVASLGVFLRLHKQLTLDVNALAESQGMVRRVSKERLAIESEAIELIKAADMRDLKLLVGLAQAMQGR